MELIIVLFVIIIILGALFGGKSFGNTIRKGCGCLTVIVMIIFALVVFMTISYYKDNPKAEGQTSEVTNSVFFEVKHDCNTYKKPDINSGISGNLKSGDKLHVENMRKFKYFYELNIQGKKSYVLKEDLKKLNDKKDGKRSN